ncbi:MAG: hypothetical protein AAF430_14095 [Myxococcota bacterium]
MDFAPPIAIDGLLEDPSAVRELLERHAPYAPVQRYLRSDAEYRNASGSGAAQQIIAPNFRGDWAFEGRVEPGAELFLEHPTLVDAAARLFESDLVRPFAVFSNITWQLPFSQGGGHTDVPAFRGIDRREYPTWLLGTMGHSRLFESERIRIATAVAWFYAGPDGGFEYWPDGPEAASVLHEGAIANTAIMGDNDFMYHRVRPVGRREDGFPGGLSLDSRLEHTGGDDWRIVDGDRVIATPGFDALRVSVSWKAYVFRDEDERDRVDAGTDALTIDAVWQRFYTDLDARSVAFERPDAPLDDAAFIDLLSRTYMRAPQNV